MKPGEKLPFAGCRFGRSAASQKEVTVTLPAQRPARLHRLDENFLYGLAGFWLFGGSAFTGISATRHYDRFTAQALTAWAIRSNIAQKTAHRTRVHERLSGLNTHQDAA